MSHACSTETVAGAIACSTRRAAGPCDYVRQALLLCHTGRGRCLCTTTPPRTTRVRQQQRSLSLPSHAQTVNSSHCCSAPVISRTQCLNLWTDTNRLNKNMGEPPTQVELSTDKPSLMFKVAVSKPCWPTLPPLPITAWLPVQGNPTLAYVFPHCLPAVLSVI